MLEPQSALQGQSTAGFATVSEAGLCGMVSIRASLDAPALAQALAALGLGLPGQRAIVTAQGRALAWMSPDELLLLCAYDEAAQLADTLAAALAGAHALVVNVSDARALFTISGAKADQVLMKLCPVDFDMLKPGEMRRTRAGQVAAALWRSAPEEISLICFRSVAGYVMGVLEVAARRGGEIR